MEDLHFASPLDSEIGIRIAVIMVLIWLGPHALDAQNEPLPIQPRAEALRAIENLEATKISVDSQRHLWAWTRRLGTLTTVSPHGVVLSEKAPVEADALSFDTRYGMAWLEPAGGSLVVRTGRSRAEPRLFSVKQDYGDLAWLGPDRIALSTTRADVRIEVMDLSSGEIVERWGAEEPVSARPGTVRLNYFWLHFDHERRLLYSLDSFTGDLRVFDLEGVVKASGTVPDEDGQALREWLDATDAENRREGEMEEVTLHRWSGLAVDQEGAAWIHKSCERSGDSKNLVSTKLSLSGEMTGSTMDLGNSGCCSSTSVRWGDWWVLYRDPESPRDGCVQIWRIGNEAHENVGNRSGTGADSHSDRLPQP